MISSFFLSLHYISQNTTKQEGDGESLGSIGGSACGDVKPSKTPGD